MRAIINKPIEPLLPESEAIALLGLQTRKNPCGAIKWLVRTGRLKAVTLGRGVRSYRRSDLQALIDACSA